MQCGIFLTAIGTLFWMINGVLLSESPAARTPGYLDFDNLPETNFTCEGKVIGGYYADVETGCQMFHVCTIGQKGDMTDIKFLCLNGTVFDQETRVCERVDEVDCKRSQDFYNLNLELYHSAGGIQPEDAPNEEKKPSESEETGGSDEIYDDSYELDTEEPPTTARPTTTTTTTTTTTPKPVFTSPIPFNIVLPNIKNKNTGTHLTGFAPSFSTTSVPSPAPNNPNENRNTGTHLTGFVPGIPSQSPRPFAVTPTPFWPPKPSPTPSSFGQPQVQQFGYQPATTYPKVHGVEAGLKPPSYQNYNPGSTSTSFKPPGYDGYKNFFFPSSTPAAPMLVDHYGHKTQQSEEFPQPSRTPSNQFEQPNRPSNQFEVSRPSNQFEAPVRPNNQYEAQNRPNNQYEVPSRPTTNPFTVPNRPSNQYEIPNRPSNQYEVPNRLSNPSRPSNQYESRPNNQFENRPNNQFEIRNPFDAQSRPSSQSEAGLRPTITHHGHHFPAPTKGGSFETFSSPGSSGPRHKPPRHKTPPTILALQSQQKKVHQLHQEGLEHAEHQIAQIATRNAEISNLHSQRDETARSYETGIESREFDNEKSATREVNEIRASNKAPNIAVVTSVSSSSRIVQKQPITSFVKTVTNEKGVAVSQEVYSASSQLKSELGKFLKSTSDKQEDESNMDLEQLLLAWKLKTNQDVTKSDIEKVFHSLDLSKFKNGETISLTDIFQIMNSTNSDKTTKSPPSTYDEYTEEDVPFDPFFKDVPKVQGSRSKRQSQVHVVPVSDNGKFRSHAGRRKGKLSPAAISIADIEVLTGSVHGRERPKDGQTSDDDLENDTNVKYLVAGMPGKRGNHLRRVDDIAEDPMFSVGRGEPSDESTKDSTAKEPAVQTRYTPEPLPLISESYEEDGPRDFHQKIRKPQEVVETGQRSRNFQENKRIGRNRNFEQENRVPLRTSQRSRNLNPQSSMRAPKSFETEFSERSQRTAPRNRAPIPRNRTPEIIESDFSDSEEADPSYEALPRNSRPAPDRASAPRNRALFQNSQSAPRPAERAPVPRNQALPQDTSEEAEFSEPTVPKFRVFPGNSQPAPERPSRTARGRGSTKFRPYGDEIPKEGSTVRPYPKTNFHCRDKIPGGFYADTEVDCQLFHICTDAGNGALIDQHFFCGTGTRFNQRSRTCQAEDLVDCSLSTKYYHLNENFKGGAQSVAVAA